MMLNLFSFFPSVSDSHFLIVSHIQRSPFQPPPLVTFNFDGLIRQEGNYYLGIFWLMAGAFSLNAPQDVEGSFRKAFVIQIRH